MGRERERNREMGIQREKQGDGYCEIEMRRWVQRERKREIGRWVLKEREIRRWVREREGGST